MKKRISRLALEFIISFVILGALISGISSYIGYQQFKNSIERQYNTTAYDIATLVSNYLDEEVIYSYYEIAKSVSNGENKEDEIHSVVKTEEYKDIAHKLRIVKEDMRANNIFLAYVDPEILLAYEEEKEWLPITYIFDCFDENQDAFKLGVQGRLNPVFVEEIYGVITTGNCSTDYFISKNFYGYNTSALLPILMGEDTLILCVEIPMQCITESIKEYLNHAVIVSIVIIIVVIFLFMLYYYYKMIQPIKTITIEAGRFTSNVYHQSTALKQIHTKNEIGVLAKSILKMEEDIVFYIDNLKAVTKEQEKLNAELDIATHIQMSMLPNEEDVSKYEEFEITASMTPAKAVGGDFYDFFMIDEDHLVVVMADVSGKGIPAALFMMIGKTLIKEHTKTSLDPSLVFTRVNQILCKSNKEGLFITAFEGILNLQTGEFLFVNAGHEMPFLKKKDSKYKPFPIHPDFVLAGMEDTIYELGQFTLFEGDKLFLYTDGVTEATNANNELFGMKRLEQVLNLEGDLNPSDVLCQVKKEIDVFVGGAPQFDDITMLCLYFKKKKEK